ncbi:Geranylgeranyl pyrophosphate synthase [Lamellibrachia satsuma]|nr:Geranylgeranyl pyrophosphate synthase [Lamellibrachia satsuma]
MATASSSDRHSDDSQDTDYDQILLQPYRYIVQVPGKEIRTKLAEAFDHWLHVPKDKLHIIGEVTRMLHNASLLIDDIEDNSILRRGVPVAHNIYGVASTINAANYTYFLGLEKALSLDHPHITTVYTEQLLELHRGQGMDIYWRDAYTCPSEDEYKDMVIKKTGGLFGLAVRLMQLFSENKSDLKPLLDNLGLYFQIRDDYANLCSQDYAVNKSFAEDLTEGKFSFPTIHAIKSSPDNTEIINILRQRSSDENVKKYCVSVLEKLGSFDYTIKTLKALEERLLTQIEKLGGNPHLVTLIKELKKIYAPSNATLATRILHFSTGINVVE